MVNHFQNEFLKNYLLLFNKQGKVSQKMETLNKEKKKNNSSNNFKKVKHHENDIKSYLENSSYLIKIFYIFLIYQIP